MTEEERLIRNAEMHPDDAVAKEAMQILREKYDATYFWCDDCDGLVTTEANCCLNQPFVPVEDDGKDLPF